MNNQKQLSKFGKFVVAYFSYFSLSGIFALIPVIFVWFLGGFKDGLFAFIYVVTWGALYLISSSKSAKEILRYKEQGSKELVFYTFLWVVATFWPCLLYGSVAEDNVAIGLVLMVYILAAYPYLMLAFAQLPGLILLPLFPLFHIAIFFIAWKKTCLFYRDANNSFKLE
ncbi:hypothetical protein [Desulfovibrio sp. JC022]|uniref:hypothetical protein n=1 Tax=Desulfovibrio sp. JC022 TaxID=2593642 RepID=UPI0013CF6BB4|nr:hypothetical protein [Desulfovibrio sp. JC022]NDV24980.1 hypothetical protein [Desulfovibrio sp. JC022]